MLPRVARCSQPWALLRNPFGIERHGSKMAKGIEMCARYIWSPANSAFPTNDSTENIEEPVGKSRCSQTCVPKGTGDCLTSGRSCSKDCSIQMQRSPVFFLLGLSFLSGVAQSALVNDVCS